LAERDGITRRYVRHLVDLAFLSPELVESFLHGRQPVELTATRLTELDLPLDWTDQRRQSNNSVKNGFNMRRVGSPLFIHSENLFHLSPYAAST